MYTLEQIYSAHVIFKFIVLYSSIASLPNGVKVGRGSTELEKQVHIHTTHRLRFRQPISSCDGFNRKHYLATCSSGHVNPKF